MARISRDEVLHVARLARLELTGDEVELFTGQLEAILEHAATIDALDTEGVPPTAHPVIAGNVWRDDEPGPCLDHHEVMRLAPETQGGRVRVPPP